MRRALFTNTQADKRDWSAARHSQNSPLTHIKFCPHLVHACIANRDAFLMGFPLVGIGLAARLVLRQAYLAYQLCVSLKHPGRNGRGLRVREAGSDENIGVDEATMRSSSCPRRRSGGVDGITIARMSSFPALKKVRCASGKKGAEITKMPASFHRPGTQPES